MKTFDFAPGSENSSSVLITPQPNDLKDYCNLHRQYLQDSGNIDKKASQILKKDILNAEEEETLKLYHARDNFNNYLASINRFPRGHIIADLSASVIENDLTNANLSDSFLRGASFTQPIPDTANLSYSDLRGATLHPDTIRTYWGYWSGEKEAFSLNTKKFKGAIIDLETKLYMGNDAVGGAIKTSLVESLKKPKNYLGKKPLKTFNRTDKAIKSLMSKDQQRKLVKLFIKEVNSTLNHQQSQILSKQLELAISEDGKTKPPSKELVDLIINHPLMNDSKLVKEIREEAIKKINLVSEKREKAESGTILQLKFNLDDMQNYATLHRKYLQLDEKDKKELWRKKDLKDTNLTIDEKSLLLASKDFQHFCINKQSVSSPQLFGSQDLTYDLSEADFRNIDFAHMNFTNVKLDKCNFAGANLSGSQFERCELDSTDFSNAILRNVKFRKSGFKDTNFQNADLEDTLFGADKHDERNNLENVDFSNANLGRAVFNGNNLTAPLNLTNARNVEQCIFDNLYSNEKLIVLDNNYRSQYKLPLINEDFPQNQKEAILEAQKVAIGTFRGGAATLFTSSFIGPSLGVAAIGYGTTYLDLPIFNYINSWRGNEPLKGSIGIQLAKLGAILKLIDSEFKANATDKETVDAVFKACCVLAIKRLNLFGYAGTIVSGYEAIDITKTLSGKALDSYNKITPIVTEICKAEGFPQLGKAVETGVKEANLNVLKTSENIKELPQNLRNSIYSRSKKHLICAAVALVVTAAIVAVSVLTFGTVPAVALAIAAFCATGTITYLGYNKLDKAVSWGANKIKSLFLKKPSVTIVSSQTNNQQAASMVKKEEPLTPPSIQVADLGKRLQDHGVTDTGNRNVVLPSTASETRGKIR